MFICSDFFGELWLSRKSYVAFFLSHPILLDTLMGPVALMASESIVRATLKLMTKYVPSSQVSWPQWKQSASLLPAQK